MDEGMRRFASAAFYPVGTVLGRFLTPNMITTGAMLVSGLVCVLYARGNFNLGGWMMLLAGVMDIWDGQVAKLTNRISSFGAYYDSVSDRVNDALYSGGAIYYFMHQGFTDVTIWLVVFLVLSQLISYVKARAEALGWDANVGFMARGLRMMLFGIPLYIYGVRPNIWIVRGAIWLEIALATETLAHRVLHVWLQARRAEREAA
jgi:CDP-diacylglycerol--glycerol-3-phosphate 3-phosphatidyltransferase